MTPTVPQVLILLAEGFEEIETITPIDLLRRAGATVTTASLTAERNVTGRSGITIQADVAFADVRSQLFSCLVIPGGPGVRHLRADPRVRTAVLAHDEAQRWIAAICAAPTVLLDAGVLDSRRYTAHFSVAAELPQRLADQRVAVDGHIITARGAGTALDFALLLIEKLFSAETAAEVARSICA